MTRFLFAVLFALIQLCACMALAWWLCDIHPAEHYEWLSGVWHGVMFVPNWLRAFFSDGVLYKAVDYSMGYNISWWIFCIISCLGTLFDVVLSTCLSLGDD